MRRFTALAQVWTLIALFVFFGLASDSFMRAVNLRNILIQVSTLGVFASGMTFVLLLGEIDLSIAALAALSAMISAHLFANLDYQEPIPMLAGVGAATIAGLISGLTSARFRIPTFMTTLAMQLIASGLVTYISKGRVITSVSEWSAYLGSHRIGGKDGLPVIVLVALACLAVGYFILRYTRFGRYVYMTGASKPAARLAGVNTSMVLVVVMTISGFFAGLAGIVSMGRLHSAQPDATESFLMDTIGGVVLGGTSLMGGRGGMLQTLIGLLIYGTLRNGLDNIPSIDIYLKEFITGAVLLGALMVNTVFAGRAERDKTI
ncbi:MAG TPA: ABC transporter permease [Aggregatilinea sp.]|jgi:ribose transport system permease protein|uniref:ABC transporter permease n=1 Tax=Aggregatilinea sp. TaxID=2806333 RepID=UPI002C85EE10|nr:ABC transporter permease [Aggregatilinea sp.]HML21421.1 ABC transporter permease [Aggregatilinea sp.]